jgi:uncharacterized iron-regulated protein
MAVLLLLGGCGATHVLGEPGRGNPIRDVRTGHAVSEPELVTALAGARYRLLGEMHDNPEHHRLRARLVTALASKGLRPVVVMEQLERDRTAAAVSAQQAGADAERFADAVEWDRKGWSWDKYKPLVQAILTARLPVRGGNIGRAELMARVRAGARAVESAPRALPLAGAVWTDAQESGLRAEIEASHCGKLPASAVPTLVLAQRARDAALAQSMREAATADGAILLAGNGHVRKDRGVPIYLDAMPGARGSISVGFIEVEPGGDLAAATADQPFDYVWITRPAERDDPCASMPLVRERS